MRGHHALLRMRRQGVTPIGGIYVDTSPASSFWSESWPEQSLSLAFVDVLPADNVAALDLRFAVGLRCTVAGEVQARVEEVTRALLAAGAAQVLSATTAVSRIVDGEREFEATWMRVHRGEVLP